MYQDDPVGRVEQRLDGLVTRVDSHGERIASNESRIADHDRQLMSLAKTAENTTRLIALYEAQQEDIRQLAAAQDKLAGGQEAIKTNMQKDRDDRTRREDQGRKDTKTFRYMFYAILATVGIGLLGLIVTLLVNSPHA